MKNLEKYSEELIREIQILRQDSNINKDEKIIAKIETKSDIIFDMFDNFGENIKNEALIERFDFSDDFQIKKEVEINGEKVVINIKRAE